MSLTYPKGKKDGTFIGSDKNGLKYVISIENTDLVHSKTKLPGYRVHFKTATTRLSFITFESNSVETIAARLQKIGYVFNN